MVERKSWIEMILRALRPGPKRSEDSFQRFGWWQFDSARGVIARESTGQSLRFVGHERPESQFKLTESGYRKWMRFEYSDSELTYPLLVERREVTLGPGQVPQLAWRADHVRSALLWIKETGSTSQNPSYGQWRRVDDCITDAFAYWPEHDKTGKPPGRIAFNGGWFNGKWEQSFYRCVLSDRNPYGRDPSTDPIIDQPLVLPLDSPPPAPWLLGPRPDDPTTEHGLPGRVEPIAIETLLDDISRTHLHFVSADGKRKLFVLPASPEALWESRIGVRLLYADPDIITDVLLAQTLDPEAGTPARWGVAFDRRFPSAIFDPDAPSSVLDRKRADFVPWVIKQGESVLPSTIKCLPLWVDQRLGEACMDILLSFSRTMLGHLRGDATAPHTSDEKACGTVSVGGVGGGGMGCRGLDAALAFKEPPGPLDHWSYMFDENLDEVMRPRAIPKDQRFWEYYPSTNALSNDAAGQRISLQGNNSPLTKKASRIGISGDNILYFLYEDRDLQYPLIVRRLADTAASQPGYIWQIDHQRSALLWSEFGNHDRPFPSYGCWRRVDACATDAFLCWPRSEATASRPWRVESKGGWLNGAWLPNLRRQCDSGIDYKYEPQPRFYYENLDDTPPSRAFLDPLDTPCFSWEYVDSREIATSAGLDFIEVRECGIPGMRSDLRLKHGLSYLPPEKDLTGFENSMPSLRRSDGRAVMFPAGLRSGRAPRGVGYSPNPFFLYADEDVAFHFEGESFAGFEQMSLPSSWSFKLDSIFRIALRRREQFDLSQPDMAPPDLFAQSASRVYVARYPTAAFSRKLTAALTEGWIAWTGTERRLLDDPARLAEIAKQDPDTPPLEQSGIDLKQKKSVRVEGGYIGGRYSSRNTITVWIDDA